jgi:UDP-glucose 6-dehydrogenase
LIKYLLDIGVNNDLIKSIQNFNKYHLDFMIDDFINKNPDKNKDYVFDSLTYKKGTVILEESQQLLFVVELANRGYKIIIKEHPEVIKEIKEEYSNLFKYL